MFEEYYEQVNFVKTPAANKGGQAFLNGRMMPVKSMAKLVLGLCAFLLACSMSFACAEPSACPYDIHLSIMYNYLSEPLQLTFDRMYDALFNGQSSIRVASGVSRSEAEWLVDFIYNEAPELCAYDRWATKVVGSSAGNMEIHLAYKRPLSVQKQFVEQVAKDARNYAGKKSSEGIRAIHDALIRYFEYGKVPGEDTQLAYDALKNRKAVCNGYAQTIAMYCHFAGYSCSYVVGQAYDRQGGPMGGHAWNVACADGKFIWFDATWNDEGKKASSQWYGLNSREMAIRHVPDEEYIPIMNLTSVLPDNVTFSMHLDINNDGGFVRGVTDKTGRTVKAWALDADEYYTPAMVVWNNSDDTVTVEISYRLNGEYSGHWKTGHVKPGSNIAFRTNADFLKDCSGTQEIIWYCNGIKLDSFAWKVK